MSRLFCIRSLRGYSIYYINLGKLNFETRSNDIKGKFSLGLGLLVKLEASNVESLGLGDR